MKRWVVFVVSMSLLWLVELSNWNAMPDADYGLSSPTGSQTEAGQPISEQTDVGSDLMFVVLLGGGVIGLAGVGMGKRNHTPHPEHTSSTKEKTRDERLTDDHVSR